MLFQCLFFIMLISPFLLLLLCNKEQRGKNCFCFVFPFIDLHQNEFSFLLFLFIKSSRTFTTLVNLNCEGKTSQHVFHNLRKCSYFVLPLLDNTGKMCFLLSMRFFYFKLLWGISLFFRTFPFTFFHINSL